MNAQNRVVQSKESVVSLLSTQQRLFYQAFEKIQEGDRLIREGRLELDQLTGTGKHSKRGVRGGQTVTKAVQKIASKAKTIANRTSKRKSWAQLTTNARLTERIAKDVTRADAVFDLVKRDPWLTVKDLSRSTKSDRGQVERSISILLKDKKVRRVMKTGNPRHTKFPLLGNKFSYLEPA